jgi:hypothetical protein
LYRLVIPIITDVVQASEKRPVKAMKKDRLFQPVGRISDTKPTVV